MNGPILPRAYGPGEGPSQGRSDFIRGSDGSLILTGKRAAPPPELSAWEKLKLVAASYLPARFQSGAVPPMPEQSQTAIAPMPEPTLSQAQEWLEIQAEAEYRNKVNQAMGDFPARVMRSKALIGAPQE